MKLKDIINTLEAFAPPAWQESYDNSGLLTGNGDMEISKALLCLDSTEEVLDEAISKGCNLVIAHHPIVFSGLKRFNGNSYIERVIIKALKNDIAIYAMHTNLDNVRKGVNAKIAEKLGLVNTRILTPKRLVQKKLITFVPIDDAEKVRQAMFDAGAGHIGNYSETSFNMEGYGTFKAEAGANPTVGEVGERHKEKELRVETIFPSYMERQIVQALIAVHPYEEVAYDVVPMDNVNDLVGAGMVGDLETEMMEKNFLLFIKDKLKAEEVRYTALLNKPVKKVAVCGGSGSFLLNDAIKAGADVFITADFKYHQFFDAENRIVIADIGHYETEQFTPEIFHSILTEKFSNFVVIFAETNTNPINYL
jgi:dinuclear metal center YbgI/SA1388 family protein